MDCTVVALEVSIFLFLLTFPLIFLSVMVLTVAVL